LPPGLYEVSVELTGFRRSVYQDVRLDVDQTARVDFALKVGRPNDVVMVTETVPLVQTDTSTLGQVINRRQVSELPLNERNFLTFALLVPGGQMPVDGSINSTQGGAISVNGAREQSNNFMLDGVDNNDLYINQYSVLPSVEAIQEFKVQSGNYSAEYGRSGGAQINLVLKSGTNQFHGSAFEFMRNRSLDAKNFFDLPECTPNSVPGTCGPIPRFDRNQFGGTLGGPIQKLRVQEGLCSILLCGKDVHIPHPKSECDHPRDVCIHVQGNGHYSTPPALRRATSGEGVRGDFRASTALSLSARSLSNSSAWSQ
jgi:hypothetical protein